MNSQADGATFDRLECIEMRRSFVSLCMPSRNSVNDTGKWSLHRYRSCNDDFSLQLAQSEDATIKSSVFIVPPAYFLSVFKHPSVSGRLNYGLSHNGGVSHCRQTVISYVAVHLIRCLSKMQYLQCLLAIQGLEDNYQFNVILQQQTSCAICNGISEFCQNLPDLCQIYSKLGKNFLIYHICVTKTPINLLNGCSKLFGT